MGPRTVATALALSLGVAALPRATPSQEAQPFRARTDVVVVDVVVTGNDGLPVSGLTREQFEVREDEAIVEIASFEAVTLSNEPVATVEDASGTAMGSNAVALEGRLVVIVLDDLFVSLDPGHLHRLKRAASAVIDGLGPTDQAALLTTSGRRERHLDFTTDRRLLKDALEGLWRRGAGIVPGEVRLRVRWETLLALATHLEPLAARRKAIALIGEGFPLHGRNPGFAMVAGLMFDFYRAAQRANVAVYPFDPGSVLRADVSLDTTPNAAAVRRTEHRLQIDELMTIADNTGGFATLNTNGLEDGAARMLVDTGSYYRIGYYTRAPHDGRAHAIDVRVAAPDVRVRARKTYVAPLPADNAISRPDDTAGAVAVPASSDASLDALATGILQRPGLTLHVVATPVPATTPTRSAIAAVTEFDADAVADWEGLDVVALAVDDRGTVVARDRYSAKLPAGGPGAGRRIRVATRLDVGRGRHQVRVAVQRMEVHEGKAGVGDGDGSGDGGSVFLHVDVPDFRRGLQPGGLVLGLPGIAGVAGADRIRDLLPMTPLATRQPPVGAPLILALPLRASGGSTPIDFTTTLTAPDGTARTVARESRPAAEFSGPGGGVYTLPLTLDEVEVGPYMLKVEVARGRTTRERLLAIERR